MVLSAHLALLAFLTFLGLGLCLLSLVRLALSEPPLPAERLIVKDSMVLAIFLFIIFVWLMYLTRAV
jgi:hypothetical protein